MPVPSEAASAIDWTTLATQTTQYAALSTITDPVSNLVDVVYCGLYAKLSDVIAGLTATNGNSVAIFVDTLLLDAPAVPASGLIIMARNVDVKGLNGQPLVLRPPSGSEGLAQFLISQTTGGAFQVASPKTGAIPVTPAVAPSLAEASLYTLAPGGDLAVAPSGGAASVTNLISRSWAMNSLLAGFTGAAWLLDNAVTANQATAASMLAYEVTATSLLAAGGQSMPSDYAQLYNQASALLVTANVASGATFVPVLSGDFYSQQMTQLVTVLAGYEANISTLDLATDIKAAIATVSTAIGGSASDETGPLLVQLDNIKQNITALYEDIRVLRGDFQLQGQKAHTDYQLMGDAIAIDAIKAKLQAEMDMAMSAIATGFDVAKIAGGDTSAWKDAVADSVATVTNLAAVIEAAQAQGGGSGDDLSAGALTLLGSQNTLMQTVLAGNLLWQQALADQAGGVLPTNLASITIDPVTDWDNYMTAANAGITNLKADLNSGGAAAAETYRADLTILTSYGKAIGAKFAAYVAQLVQATVILAQVKAAKDVEARWAAVEQAATSDEEKLAALKAVVQSRANAIKRAIYVAWTYYSASYFYLNFVAPPHVVHLDMDSADLGAALAGVSAWVAGAVGAQGGQPVKLPNNNAQIELDYAILQPGAAAASGDSAILLPAPGGGWTLTWTLPLGSAQLDGVLPNQGQCAIWISQATFLLDGVTGNAKGNLIATVATSGAYQNGFGPAVGHAFSTGGLTGDYAYKVASGTVYSPWAINMAVYMTPTPYTQWTMTLPPGGGDPTTATRLRVLLTVAYLTP